MRRCAAALRSPSSTWSATRTWPTCSRRWPTAVSSPCRKETSRSPTRRCCANGHACASGSKRTPKGAGFAATSPRRRREWDAAGRDRGELYRGARLAAALDWTADHALDVNELEREFVTESREASETGGETRSAHEPAPSCPARRGRGPAGGGGRGWDASRSIQRGEARDAETAQLAQRLGAQALVEDDLDRSLLLARQAVAIDESPQTRSYLLEALLRSPKADGIMHGRTEFLRTIDVSRDGRTLAVGSFRDGLLFFDTRTYARIGGKSPVTGNVESLAYGPGGDTLAVGGDGFIRLLDASTYEQLAETLVDGLVTRLIFSRDGSRLVVATGETVPDSISIRDAATLARIGAPIEPEGYAGAYRAQLWGAPGLALTPDGSSVLTASKHELVWWDLRSRSATRRVRIGTGHHALALSSDGDTAAVGVDRGIQLIDTRSGAVRSSAGVLTDAPNWLIFSSDGRTVVSTGLDGAVTLWDVRSATVRETLRGHSASAAQPEFSPDGKTLYTTSHDGTAIAWRIAGDRGLGRPFEFTPGRAARDFRHPGAYVLDGRLIAVGLKGRGIGFRDGETLARAGAPLLKTGGEVNALASDPDGRLLAAGTKAGMVTLWDVASRSLRLGPFSVSKTSVESLSLSADETLLATSGQSGVRLWDVATGAARGRVGDGSSAGAVAFSPAAPLVALVVAAYDGDRPDPDEDAGVVEVWNVTRRSLVMRPATRSCPGRHRLRARLHPGRPGACQRRARRPVRSPLGRREGKAAPRARAERGRRALARVQPGRSYLGGRGVRRAVCGAPRRRDGGAARPEAHGRQRQRDDRCVP